MADNNQGRHHREIRGDRESCHLEESQEIKGVWGYCVGLVKMKDGSFPYKNILRRRITYNFLFCVNVKLVEGVLCISDERQ